ncbi:hypothetical protein MMC30_002666 [Trapelia coarctata]|nr:hypothetical protein [Trapelia coarctata]
MSFPLGYSPRSSRTLEELKNGTDILSGADSQALRVFCTSEVLTPIRDFNDEYGRRIVNRRLEPFQAHFQFRVEALSGDTAAAAHELSALKWGPTKQPIFTVVLMFLYLNPPARSTYIAIAEWLIKSAMVPVDSADLSGTTAMMHAISTKPYLDTTIAQILFDAGSQINHRNRYGATAAHEIVIVRQLDSETKRRAVEALQWFIAHGGDRWIVA